jgi:hypothetical protein
MDKSFPLISVLDDRIIIDKLRPRIIEGNVQHLGDQDITGRLKVSDNVIMKGSLTVSGELTIDTIRVKNLITEESKQPDAFTFEAEDPKKLDLKGLLWHHPETTHQFVFRNEPRRIFSSESIDLHRNAKYQINGVDVLESGRLSNSVIHSNLKSVGVLEELKVRGPVSLSDTVFVNHSLGRFGINTDQPNAALSVMDDLVEVVIGSSDSNTAFIGTWGPQTLNIITDNTNRIVIKDNTVTIGSAKSKNSVLNLNGKLNVFGDVDISGNLKVDSIVSDIRIEKTSSVEFLHSEKNSIYGKGLTWKGLGSAKNLFLLSNPDRLYSTEHLELSQDKNLYIGGFEVLNSTRLGSSVTESNIKRLGVLEHLSVSGDVELSDLLSIKDRSIVLKSGLSLKDASGDLYLDSSGIKILKENFHISVNESIELSINPNGSILIGNKENTSRNVNVYGKLSVNITNPDPESSFSINGMMKINNRKIFDGAAPPEQGSWNKGDIIYNSDPNPTSYIGWVCVMTGTPGSWKPFGYIGER